MLKKFFVIAFVFFGLVACDDDSTNTVEVDLSLPQGTFTASKSGSFVEQNSTGSTGTAELGMDESGVQFIRFGSNFNTNLGTGTVTVYLSTSDEYVADPANGNPDLLLVGPVKTAGENYFKLSPSADSKFTHVLLWCGSANIPFGYAELN